MLTAVNPRRAGCYPRSFSFGVVLWELLTWRLPWAGSGLSPFQVGGGRGQAELVVLRRTCTVLLMRKLGTYLLASQLNTRAIVPPIPPWPQIGAKVVAGERLEVPPREALPGPDTAAFGGLDAYCELLQECWAGQPERRPGMAQVVRRLRALLEACGGGGSGGGAQYADGGGSKG